MLLATIGFLLAQTTPAPNPAPAAFAGVTFGETEQALVTQMGEPVSRNAADSGAIQYAYVGTGNSLEFVRIERGNVVAVAITPSPWRDDLAGAPPSAMGISLGDSPAKLVQLGKDRFVPVRKLAAT
jgi:hypothetical protein